MRIVVNPLNILAHHFLAIKELGKKMGIDQHRTSRLPSILAPAGQKNNVTVILVSSVPRHTFT